MKHQSSWRSVRLAILVSAFPLGIVTSQEQDPDVRAPQIHHGDGSSLRPHRGSQGGSLGAAFGDRILLTPEVCLENLRLLQPGVGLIGTAGGEAITLPGLDSAASWLPRSAFEAAFDPCKGEDAGIRDHLAAVIEFLENRDVSRLAPSLREQRSVQLGRLSNYRERGIFPHNDHSSGLVPFFIDGQGHSCAVAYLMMESGARELAESIARTQNNAYVPGIDVPGVAEWIAGSGLDTEECAWIQPSYGRPLLLSPILPAPADFSAHPLKGTAPLNVRFWGTSHPPATSHWDFGDGGISNQRNPLHSYTTPGTYTVSLTVRFGPYSDSKTRVGYIHVLP